MEKTRKGCLSNLLQLVLYIAVPLMLTSLLVASTKEYFAKDEIAKSLIPFQNSYFGFHDYFVTVERLSPSWVLRLLVFFVPTILLFAVINAVLTSIFKETKLYNFLFRTIFYSALGFVLLLVWFIPQKKTYWNISDRKLVVIDYGWGQKEEVIIPFSEITQYSFKISLRKSDRYVYQKFLQLRVSTKSDDSYLIGVNFLGEFQVRDWANHSGITEYQPTDDETQYANDIIGSINTLMQ